MYQIEMILEFGLLLVFAYETGLATQKVTDEVLEKQKRLKFFATPMGILLFITFIVGTFSDLHYLIGIAFLLIIIIVGSTLVPRGFRVGKPMSISLWIRNFLMLLMFFYDIILPIFEKG